MPPRKLGNNISIQVGGPEGHAHGGGVCAACSRNLGVHSPEHDKILQMEALLPFVFGGALAQQVIDALKLQTDEAYKDMLKLMETNPMAYVQALNLSANSSSEQ